MGRVKWFRGAKSSKKKIVIPFSTDNHHCKLLVSFMGISLVLIVGILKIKLKYLMQFWNIEKAYKSFFSPSIDGSRSPRRWNVSNVRKFWESKGPLWLEGGRQILVIRLTKFEIGYWDSWENSCILAFTF